MQNQIQPCCLHWQAELEKTLLVLWEQSRPLKKEDFSSIQNGIYNNHDRWLHYFQIESQQKYRFSDNHRSILDFHKALVVAANYI